MGLLSAGDAGAAPSSLVRFSSSASLHRSSKLASRSSVVWKASKMPKRGSPASEVYSHVTADFSFPLRRYVLKETLDMPPCLYHSITLARMMARLSALSDVAIIERSFGWQSLSCAAMRDTAASSSAPDISPAAMRLSSGSTSSLFCSAMLSRQLVMICFALRCTRRCFVEERLERRRNNSKTFEFMCVKLPRKSSTLRMSETLRSSCWCESTACSTLAGSLSVSLRWSTPTISERSSG
mmetsp:Transcript_26466/g.80284  ORF Transcript_26466/g.80284 Transcript_26466/m.80284 type:complete len:239 (-) Transcript_26466:246-962(-)